MKEHRYLAWKNLEKKYCPGHAAAALSDLREVIGEFFLFDDEKPVFIRLDQPKVVEALHKQADPWPRGAHHLGEFFMGNLEFDTNAARIFLTQGAGELQQRLTQTLFAIHCHQVGDDLLLIGNAHRQIAHEALKQRVAA